MNRIKSVYQYLFGGLLILFGAITLYALQATETPRIILFLGRFHPLLLHLPIGALVVGFFMDVVGRIQKNYPIITIKMLLGFTAFFSIITCFLGYFLSLEGGYMEDTLDIHFYTGILTAVLTTALFIFSMQPEFESNKGFLSLFVAALVSISIAGHFGSILTHGDNFLTEYARTPEKERTIEVIDSLRMYPDVVAKILDAKCVQCHNNTKQKGALSLVSKAGILTGGETGPSLIAGNAAGSLLYSQLLLPISHEDHMPPEGKEQLTKDEISLLEHWISDGLDFTKHVDRTSDVAGLEQKLGKYLVFKTATMDKAAKSDIESVSAAGFRVQEIVPGEAALSVKFIQTTPTKDALDVLSELKEQIVELDFQTAPLTDPMTGVLKKMTQLKTLIINSAQMTDEGLKNLKNLTQLEVLNVYNTGITNEGVIDLLKRIQPKQMYVWQTKVGADVASQLEKEYNISIQHSIAEDFVSISALEVPRISPTKTLFVDTIHVNVDSRLKGAELRYTTDGSLPDTTAKLFKKPLVLAKSQTLKVAAFKEGWLPSEVLSRAYIKVEHRVKDFSIRKLPSEKYSKANALFDLQEGSLSFGDGSWTGFSGDNLDITLDLGAIKEVHNISFNCLEDVGSWILFPKSLRVSASQTKDGVYKDMGAVTISRKGEGGEPEIKKITLPLPETSARYFRVRIENYNILPSWHPGAGNSGWLFVDEIYVW